MNQITYNVLSMYLCILFDFLAIEYTLAIVINVSHFSLSLDFKISVLVTVNHVHLSKCDLYVKSLPGSVDQTNSTLVFDTPKY